MESKLKITCDFCGKTFLRYKGRNHKHSFCSLECSRKYRVGKPSTGKRPKKVLSLIPCSYCSQPIERWRYQLERRNLHFCNAKCKGTYQSLYKIADKACNWKGGTYSTIANTICNSRYRRIRKVVVAMDNSLCQLCGSDIKLEVHHIIEKGKNPTLVFDVTNMITLCKKCHCSIRGHEDDYVGFFDGIVANRMNCWKPRTGNQQPSVQSTKVQRLLESSDTLNNQLELPTRKG